MRNRPRYLSSLSEITESRAPVRALEPLHLNHLPEAESLRHPLLRRFLRPRDDADAHDVAVR